MDHKVTLSIDADVVEKLLPSLEWALENDVLTDEEASKVMVEEIVASMIIDG